MRLTSEQRKIVKASKPKKDDVYGSRYERVMDAVQKTIGHHVYEYVLVEKLMEIIAKI